jgi:hypothetical protein
MFYSGSIVSGVKMGLSGAAIIVEAMNSLLSTFHFAFLSAVRWYKHTQTTVGKSSTSAHLSWAVLVLVERRLAMEKP